MRRTFLEGQFRPECGYSLTKKAPPERGIFDLGSYRLSKSHQFLTDYTRKSVKNSNNFGMTTFHSMNTLTKFRQQVHWTKVQIWRIPIIKYALSILMNYLKKSNRYIADERERKLCP